MNFSLLAACIGWFNRGWIPRGRRLSGSGRYGCVRNARAPLFGLGGGVGKTSFGYSCGAV